MTDAPQQSVVLIGVSPPIRCVFKEVVVSNGIRTRQCNSVDECCDWLARENRNLLVVVDLSGDRTHEVQSLARMKKEYPQIPVLACVERGDIPTAVRAVKAGAANCLEKPIEAEQLTSAIEELFRQDNPRAGRPRPPLTPMEITVVGYVLEGRTTRQIAGTLCRSPRTIEVHRSHIMHKLNVSNMVDLVKAASNMNLPAGSYREASRLEDV